VLQEFEKLKRVESGALTALFVWLISHQPALLFSQNKPVTSNQPSVFFSEQINTSHQAPAKRTCCTLEELGKINQKWRYLASFLEEPVMFWSLEHSPYDLSRVHRSMSVACVCIRLILPLMLAFLVHL
jgi:hypothetical protein